MSPDPIPRNWPFPTYKGRPVPKPKRVRAPKPVYPDAPF